MAERTVIGHNGTPILTLCLTLTNPNLNPKQPNPTLTNQPYPNQTNQPTQTLKLTIIYAVQLPNVFRKLIVTS